MWHTYRTILQVLRLWVHGFERSTDWRPSQASNLKKNRRFRERVTALRMLHLAAHTSCSTKIKDTKPRPKEQLGPTYEHTAVCDSSVAGAQKHVEGTSSVPGPRIRAWKMLDKGEVLAFFALKKYRTTLHTELYHCRREYNTCFDTVVCTKPVLYFHPQNGIKPFSHFQFLAPLSRSWFVLRPQDENVQTNQSVHSKIKWDT